MILWSTELRTLELQIKENLDQEIFEKLRRIAGILLEKSRGC
jgi:hypothetical protein